MRSIEDCIKLLHSRRLTSEALLEECLAAIDDPAGEGSRTFLRVYRDEALTLARATDRARRSGARLPAFAGVPISVKDLFDVEGEPTPAGSRILADAPPAAADAPVIARLRASGFILVGRTNMTEFAYSGVGLNPHFGTPKNPYDRDTARIPGGSSSGAAVSVSDGMAVGAVGTDTGGSCRIPAALSGLVGFKPTARRIPLAGAIPLSPSLDAIGPLAATVASCTLLDAVLSGAVNPELDPAGASLAADKVAAGSGLAGMRFAVPRSLVLDDVDRAVGASFDRTLSLLSAQGGAIVEIPADELMELPRINAGGGFAAAEAWAWHRELLSENESRYDPRVAVRIRQGSTQSAADYLELLAARRALQQAMDREVARVDALVMPTVPVIAPPISALENDDDYFRINRLVLRNPSIVNFLDLCAISLPCHAAGDAPVGVMLVGGRGEDRHLLELARRVEPVLQLR